MSIQGLFKHCMHRGADVVPQIPISIKVSMQSKPVFLIRPKIKYHLPILCKQKHMDVWMSYIGAPLGSGVAVNGQGLHSRAITTTLKLGDGKRHIHDVPQHVFIKARQKN